MDTHKRNAQFCQIQNDPLPKVRLLVSAYTSGSAICRGWVSDVQDSLAAIVFDKAVSGLAKPTFGSLVGGADGSTYRDVAVKIADPAATDPGFVTRPLPLKSATATAHASTTVEGTVVTLLAANANRKRFMVQNAGTVPVKLGFGTTDPTATSYHIALAGSTGADDGTGDTYIDDMWTGAVEAIGATGGKVVVTELT